MSPDTPSAPPRPLPTIVNLDKFSPLHSNVTSFRVRRFGNFYGQRQRHQLVTIQFTISDREQHLPMLLLWLHYIRYILFLVCCVWPDMSLWSVLLKCWQCHMWGLSALSQSAEWKTEWHTGTCVKTCQKHLKLCKQCLSGGRTQPPSLASQHHDMFINNLTTVHICSSYSISYQLSVLAIIFHVSL